MKKLLLTLVALIAISYVGFHTFLYLDDQRAARARAGWEKEQSQRDQKLQQTQADENQKQAEENRKEEELVALCRAIGHVDLRPTDTSRASLNRILRQLGSGPTTDEATANAISFSWLQGMVKAKYFKPGYIESQAAASITLSIDRSREVDGGRSSVGGKILKAKPKPLADLVDIAFAGLRPGRPMIDLESQLRRAGAVMPYSTWTDMRKLPSGWTVSWAAWERDSDVVHELIFDNPKYELNPR